jgi:hypothetical protein
MRLVEILGPHLPTVAHSLLPVQVLLGLGVALHRPPRIGCRPLLPLIGRRIMLIDISGPVTEDIICRSGPSAIDRSTARPSAGYPPRSREVPL